MNPENDEEKAFSSFDDMPLSDALLRGIYTVGLERPTAQQQRLLWRLLQSEDDLLINATGGSGTTVALAILLLQRCFAAPTANNGSPQACLLCHTREAALQTEAVIRHLGAFVSDSQSVSDVFVGGRRLRPDIERLQDGRIAIVVGSMGRIMDLVARGKLQLSNVNLVVMDDAGVLLQAATPKQQQFLQQVPASARLVFATTNMPQAFDQTVQSLTSRTLVRLFRSTDRSETNWIVHFYVVVSSAEEKQRRLAEIFDACPGLVIAFANSRMEVTRLVDQHRDCACALHGNLTQQEREANLHAFKSGERRVLIATEMFVKGIDAPYVRVVVNTQWPTSEECYEHRTYRLENSSSPKAVISFVSTREELAQLESWVPTVRALPTPFHFT